MNSISMFLVYVDMRQHEVNRFHLACLLSTIPMIMIMNKAFIINATILSVIIPIPAIPTYFTEFYREGRG